MVITCDELIMLTKIMVSETELSDVNLERLKKSIDIPKK